MKQIDSSARLPADDKFYRRLPLYRWLAAALTFIAVVICSTEQIARRDGDPYLFVNAARQLLHGQDIYTHVSEHGNYYYYPPFFAFLNIPLTLLPGALVVVLWSIASVCLLAWSMAAFYSGMTGQPFFSLPARTRWIVCFFSSALTARFTILHLRFGQSNILVLALAVLALTWIARRRDVRAGIAIGLSLVIKLTTVPFVVWFLARLNSKVLIGLVLGGLIAVTAPALVVGLKRDVSYHREWAEMVALANAPGSGSWTGIGNISLRAQIDRFFLRVPTFTYKNKAYSVTLVELPATVVRILGQLALLCIVLAIGWYAVRFRNAPELVSQWGGYAFVFSLIPNFSIVAEIPHLVLLLPAYIYVVHIWHFNLTRDRLFRCLVVLSFVFTTLTTKTFCGPFLGGMLTSLGVISWGMILLSAAIFRAGTLIRRDSASETADGGWATKPNDSSYVEVQT